MKFRVVNIAMATALIVIIKGAGIIHELVKEGAKISCKGAIKNTFSGGPRRQAHVDLVHGQSQADNKSNFEPLTRHCNRLCWISACYNGTVMAAVKWYKLHSPFRSTRKKSARIYSRWDEGSRLNWESYCGIFDVRWRWLDCYDYKFAYNDRMRYKGFWKIDSKI